MSNKNEEREKKLPINQILSMMDFSCSIFLDLANRSFDSGMSWDQSSSGHVLA